jgi:hypothetical protein
MIRNKFYRIFSIILLFLLWSLKISANDRNEWIKFNDEFEEGIYTLEITNNIDFLIEIHRYYVY